MSVDQTYLRENRAHELWSEKRPFFPEEKESAALFVDANSILRNSTATASAIRPMPGFTGLFVAGSAAAGGIVGIPLGLSIVRDGYKKAKESIRVRDWEGALHKSSWSAIGLGYAGLSSMLAVDGIMKLKGKAPPATLNTAFGAAGIGFYSALLGYSSYGLYQTVKFQKELKLAQSQGRALDWLKSELTLSKEESSQPHAESLLQKKWRQFEFRTNAKCSALIREKLPHLENEAQAREWIVEVEKANFKESLKYLILVILALLGIAASVCVLLFAGFSSPLLFAIGSVVWLGIDSSSLHEYLGEKCWAIKKGGLALPLHDASKEVEEHAAAEYR